MVFSNPSDAKSVAHIGLSQLEEGLYILSLEDESGMRSTQKLQVLR